MLSVEQSSARIQRPSFRENKPKRLVFSHWKPSVFGLFHKNWVYKFRHWSRAVIRNYGSGSQFNHSSFNSALGKTVGSAEKKLSFKSFCEDSTRLECFPVKKPSVSRKFAGINFLRADHMGKVLLMSGRGHMRSNH
jgi:hypothetical protein